MDHPTTALGTLSTHVLDAALGRPADTMSVVLDPERPEPLVAMTDRDGRVRFAAPVAAGLHRLVFATGPWFAAADRDTFFPEVTVAFEVAPGQHYHVALLLSPYSYTTYRGS